MFDNFLVSDWIQFLGVIVSLIIGIASIIIAMVTLRQNSRMLADSTRPYVVILFERTYTSAQRCYFVIKNYGQTGAYITRFECLTDLVLKELGRDKIDTQIHAIQNSFLAPNQKLCLVFSEPLNTEKADFCVEYRAGKKVYKENFSLHIPLNLPVVRGYSTKAGEPEYLKDISHSLQEMIERNF